MTRRNTQDQKVKGSVNWVDKAAENIPHIYYCDAGFITDIPHASLEDSHSVEADSFDEALSIYEQRIKESGWHYFMPVQIGARSYKYANYGRRTRKVNRAEYTPAMPTKVENDSSNEDSWEVETAEFIDPIEEALAQEGD